MNKQVDSKKYFDSMHRLGRIMTVITLLVFFGVPLVTCLVYGIMPSMGQIFAASATLILVLVPSSLGELISETPVLGSSYYLSSITGNVINMKLPAAINAQDIAGVKKGTSAADAVAGIAVAVSSLTTMLIIAVGVLVMVPLQPVLQSEFVSTASNYVVPALFGYLALGFLKKNAGEGMIVHGGVKTLVIPFVLAGVLYLTAGDFYSDYQGFLIIGFIALLYGVTRFMYKKGIVRVEMPAAQSAAPEAEEAVASTEEA